MSNYSEETVRTAIRNWSADAFKDQDEYLDVEDFETAEEYTESCEETLMNYLKELT